MDRTTVTAWREKILHACGLDGAAVRRIMENKVVVYLCKAHMPPESFEDGKLVFSNMKTGTFDHLPLPRRVASPLKRRGPKERSIEEAARQADDASPTAAKKIRELRDALKASEDDVMNRINNDVSESLRARIAELERENLMQAELIEEFKAAGVYLSWGKFRDHSVEKIYRMTGLRGGGAGVESFFNVCKELLAANGEDIERLNLYVASGSSTKNTKNKTGRHAPRTRKLGAMDQMFFTLNLLRAGHTLEQHCLYWGICASTGTSYFCTWLDVLARCLMIMMPFPDQESTRDAVPQQFVDALGSRRLRLVLDCTNINIETHSNPEVQGNTWSSYYSGNVVKILIGTSPNGAITFCSLAFPGKASDVDITQESVLRLGLLEPGDDCMADKGFAMHHLLYERLVGLWMPPKRQANAANFTAEQVKITQKIANKRIHVERAMKRIKAFSYLKRTIPVVQFDLISHMVFVCAMMSNFQCPLRDSDAAADPDSESDNE